MFVQDHPRHQRNKPANQQTNKSNHANKGTPPPPTNYQLKPKRKVVGGGSGLCLPRRGSKTYFLGCPLNNSASVSPRLCVTSVGSWKSLVRMAWTRNSACPNRSFSSCTLARQVMCELIWFWWWWVLLPGVADFSPLGSQKATPVTSSHVGYLARFLAPFFWEVWVARKCSQFGGRL